MVRCICQFMLNEAGSAPLGFAVVSVLVLGVAFTAAAARDLSLGRPLDGYLQALHQAKAEKTQQPNRVP